MIGVFALLKSKQALHDFYAEASSVEHSFNERAKITMILITEL
jgi:hypothetical protein